MDLLPHSTVEGQPATMKALNKVVMNSGCLIGIITGECKKPGCGFKHNLETDARAINILSRIVDDGAKALKLA
jgi:hypothetical protein